MAGALLSAVVCVDDFLTWFSAGNAAGDDERMAQLNGLVGTEPIPPTVDAEQTADGIAEFMRVPLWVVCAGFVGVADSDTLYVGLPQEMKHDAQTLRANSNESNINPLTGSNIACAAQHLARNDGKTNRRRGSLPQKLTARNRALQEPVR